MGRVEGGHAPGSDFSGACAVRANLKGGELAGACSSFGACVIWGGAGGSSDSLETAILERFLQFCTILGYGFFLNF